MEQYSNLNKELKILGVILGAMLLIFGIYFGIHRWEEGNSGSKGPTNITFWSSKDSPIIYNITNNEVQKAGKWLFTITLASEGTNGTSGWGTNVNPKNSRIEIHEIIGTDWKKAVAVQYLKYGPYFKAVAQ